MRDVLDEARRARADDRSLLAGGLLCLLAACSDGSGIPTTPPNPTIASIAVIPEVALLTELDDTQPFDAIARDAATNVVTGVTFQWSSDDEDVASISPAGVATSVSAGTAAKPIMITATAGEVSGTATVWVLPPEHTALDVNDSRMAVGFRRTYALVDDALEPSDVALVWAPDGTVTELPTLGGTASRAVAVNTGGKVVGTARNANGFERAFAWTAAAGIDDLGTLSGQSSSSAAGIDDGGQIVGTSWTGTQAPDVVVWASDGTIAPVADLGSGDYTPAAIGAAGDVVGTVGLPAGIEHAFRWTAQGGVVDLGTLGGSKSGAADVSASGQVVRVVGWSHLGPDSTRLRGFLWSSDTESMVDLGTIAGDTSRATALNANGQVTGHSTTSSGAHAFLWTEQGGMQDLATLGGCCSWGYGINGGGDVVGASRIETGELRAFLWRPGSGMSELAALPGG